jgi:hypothetical protein
MQKSLVFKTPHTESSHTKDVNGTMVKQIIPRIPIPPYDEIIDENGKRREIRYISGCDTIFVDEQISDKYGYKRDRKATSIEKSDLTMENGFLITYPDDKPALSKYLMMCTYNGTDTTKKRRSQPLFIQIVKEKVEKENYDTELKMFEAKKVLFDIQKDDAQLRRLGKTLIGEVDSYESLEIFNKLMKIATKDPDKVLTANKVAHSDIEDTINDAERLGVITLEGSKALWATGEELVTYKVGSNGKAKLKTYFEKSDNSSQLQTLREIVREKKMNESKKEVVA